MAIKDRNGALHSEKNGQFVSNGEGESSGFDVEKLSKEPRGRSGTIRPGVGEDPKKRRTLHVTEVKQSDGSYVFPMDFKITLFTKDFRFDEPIVVPNVITIVKPGKLSDQPRISKSYGGRFGEWCKKAGDSIVEISGKKKSAQIHFYENSDGTIARAKIVLKKGDVKNG